MKLLSFDIGIRNLACVSMSNGSAPDEPMLLHSVEVSDVIKEAGSNAHNANKVPYELVVKSVIGYLMAREDAWDLHSLTNIVLESQVKRNPRCKTAMYIIMAWFVYRYIQLGYTYKTMPKVEKVSAVHKLTVEGTGATDLPVPAAGKKGQYRRKKNATAMVTSLIQGHGRPFKVSDDVVKEFLSSPKKDDMSDAILQAVWFMDEHASQKSKKRVSRPTMSDPVEGSDSQPKKKSRTKPSESEPKPKRKARAKPDVIAISDEPPVENEIAPAPKKRRLTSKTKANASASLESRPDELPIPAQ